MLLLDQWELLEWKMAKKLPKITQIFIDKNQFLSSHAITCTVYESANYLFRYADSGIQI